jgi:DNA-directed RNA polymerase
MSNDVCRGLLEFSNGKKLGKKGVYWLKVHLANKIGHDKLPLDERADIIDNMIDLIKETVRNPLEKNWWMDVEDAWQALATMSEIVEALHSGNPEEYER